MADDNAKQQLGYGNKAERGTIGNRIADVIIKIFLILLCCTCVLPFLHLASKSISSDNAVLSKSVYLLPKDVSFAAYQSVFRDGQLVRSMLYSVLVTGIFTLLGLATTVMAAWPLSRKRLRGRTFITFVIMFTMYFSAGLIPEYLLLHDLHLLNSMWVLILPLIFSPYNFLIMKTNFQNSIPDSLEESAYLDGASNFQILIKIVLPLSQAILATIALFLAVGRWNAFQDSKFYITTKSKHIIQYLLSLMVLSSGDTATSISEASAVSITPEVLQSAAVMFATLPIICIYPFIQKYFVKGVMIGAVKG
ncbi:MAG: carbohydrate ABC transporter permease [Treponemataceae bacterium]|nr:carbohydrate ABC transporter permease [Treponemataceae bacterium]